VHISFVRSITMDAFKAGEIARMDLGGNTTFRDFFTSHSDTALLGASWEGSTIAERYGGVVGEEYKDRLTAKVEGKEYVKSSPASKPAVKRTNTGDVNPAATASLAGGSVQGGRKEQNEAFFAKLGAANATRRADLPPSQGGKYAGFGSAPPPQKVGVQDEGMPGLDELQRDPLAAVGKGLGWFAGVVGKSAKTVNDGFIAPAAQRVRLHLYMCRLLLRSIFEFHR
jgi:ADP-ribosylation factor GTPase-activating protein 1